MLAKYLIILLLLFVTSCSVGRLVETPEYDFIDYVPEDDFEDFLEEKEVFKKPEAFEQREVLEREVMKEEIAEEEKVVKKIEVAPIIKKAQDIRVVKKVFFNFDSAKLSNSASHILAAQAIWLKSNPDIKINVEGHCDERGTSEYNIALGKRRALAVKNYLVKNGVDANRVRTVSYGESRPVARGHNERAWSQNRRAVVISTYKLIKGQ